MSLSFRNEQDLINYLTSTAPGRELVRMALPHKLVRVIVKAHSDGWIEVYGPPNTCAKIIGLPHSLQRDRELEQYVDACLPWTYKELHCPGNLIATEMIETGIGFHQFTKRETNATLDHLFIEGCTRVSDSLAGRRPDSAPDLRPGECPEVPSGVDPGGLDHRDRHDPPDRSRA